MYKKAIRKYDMMAYEDLIHKKKQQQKTKADEKIELFQGNMVKKRKIWWQVRGMSGVNMTG